MAKVYLLLGSSLGDRTAYLKKAMELIEMHMGSVEKYSSVYETPPWGFNDEHQFLNQALLVDSAAEPLRILELIHAIEQALGRHRTNQGYAPRTLDIDILFYDNILLNIPELTIPHPLLHERRFALAPLCEIAPDLWHPALKQTVQQLFNSCPDNSVLKVLETKENL